MEPSGGGAGRAAEGARLVVPTEAPSLNLMGREHVGLQVKVLHASRPPTDGARAAYQAVSAFLTGATMVAGTEHHPWRVGLAYGADRGDVTGAVGIRGC